MKTLRAFQGAEHQPFHWPGGRPAALLVHGFPGTPGEMRALGQALHNTGWTVHGPLLPGFGPQVETLIDRQYSEWVAAVDEALAVLQREHDPVLLVGHSMGGALSIHVAAARPPTALVLLAPFWQLGTAWQRWPFLLLRPFFRQVRPFKRADFNDPELRRGVANFLPDVNLDDPEVQAALRTLAIPTTLFEQLYRVGQAAYRLAPQVNRPVLVIQGTADEVVSPQRTRRLIKRLAGPVRYREVPAAHNLHHPALPAWPVLEQSVLAFADFVLNGTTAS